MSFWSDSVERLRSLLFRRREEREMEEELRFHVEKATEDYVLRGMTPVEARRRALIDLGGVERTKEDIREARGVGLLEDLVRDVRYALRALRRSPGFTVVMVVTLALGIGANTAIFSVVEGVLLKPLPYPRDDQLVEIWYTGASEPGGHFSLSYQDYQGARALDGDFSEVAGYRQAQFNLSGVGQPREVQAQLVSASLFKLLGARPELGRVFDASEFREPVAVLSHKLWMQLFGGDAGALGRTIVLDGTGYTVVGVMPAGFAFPGDGAQLWAPLGRVFVSQPDLETDSDLKWLGVVGRMRDGVGMDRVDSDLAALGARLEPSGMNGNVARRQLQITGRASSGSGGALRGGGAPPGSGAPGKGGSAVRPGSATARPAFVAGRLRDDVVGDARLPLLVLLGVVGLVLIIACVNAANLWMARAGARSRELAVRRALGAGRGRLARQLLTESVVLSLAGGLAGVLVAGWGVSAILAAWPTVLPRTGSVGLDGGTLFFAFVVSVVTGIACGLMPALRSGAPALEGALREGGAGSTAGPRRHRFQRGLVAAEIALALVVLTGAGLLVRSFNRLMDVDPGYDTRNVLAARIRLSPDRYAEAAQTNEFFRRVTDELRRRPGAEEVSLADLLPMSGGIRILGMDPRTVRPDDPEPMITVGFAAVGSDFFRTLHIPLLAGRGFTDEDRKDAPPVAVVNQTLAKRLWPDGSPVGETMPMQGLSGSRDVTVVGVVGDVHYASLTDPVKPQMYLALAQQPSGPGAESSAWVLVRASGDPLGLATALRQAVRSVDASQPVATIATMNQMVSRSTASRRFDMTLVGLFALLALGLAVVGIYGVTAYIVVQRTREIGVRVALGADRGDVLALVLGETALTAVVGIALGLAGALAASRVLTRLLYGVSATDAATFGTTAAILAAAALLAAFLPARRAARIDPVRVLNQE